MRLAALALLALPCLASAVTLTLVSVPKNQGAAIVIDDVERLVDGTWVACQKDGLCVYSADQGSSWASVPALAGDTAEIMGRALVAKRGLKVWSRAKGWHDMVGPTSLTAGTQTFAYVGSEGVRSRQVGSTMTWFRSDSTWENWSEWFSVPVSGENPEEVLQAGFPALGKVWFCILDSGYARGTADGKNWSRMTLLDFEPMMITSERIGGIVTMIGLDANYTLQAGWSADSGKTWTQGGLSSPGNALLLAESGYFLSTTAALGGALEGWISRSATGGWESLGQMQGLFFEAGVPYVAVGNSLYRVEGVGTGIARSGASASGLVRLERSASSTVAHLDASLQGKPWLLLGADGSVSSRGTVTSNTLELPALRGASWLKVGSATLAIPAL